MADEKKKGGFHSLEKRIHQIEEEDRTKATQESKPDEKKAPAKEPPKK